MQAPHSPKNISCRWPVLVIGREISENKNNEFFLLKHVNSMLKSKIVKIKRNVGIFELPFHMNSTFLVKNEKFCQSQAFIYPSSVDIPISAHNQTFLEDVDKTSNRHIIHCFES